MAVRRIGFGRYGWFRVIASANRFALVVMAHLKAQESKDGVARKGWKPRLVRLMYQRGQAREDILERV